MVALLTEEGVRQRAIMTPVSHNLHIHVKDLTNHYNE